MLVETTKLLHRLDDSEKADLVATARDAAIAVAAFWDMLGHLEREYSVTIEDANTCIDHFASDCDTPADCTSLRELTATDVLDALKIMED